MRTPSARREMMVTTSASAQLDSGVTVIIVGTAYRGTIASADTAECVETMQHACSAVMVGTAANAMMVTMETDSPAKAGSRLMNVMDIMDKAVVHMQLAPTSTEDITVYATMDITEMGSPVETPSQQIGVWQEDNSVTKMRLANKSTTGTDVDATLDSGEMATTAILEHHKMIVTVGMVVCVMSMQLATCEEANTTSVNVTMVTLGMVSTVKLSRGTHADQIRV